MGLTQHSCKTNVPRWRNVHMNTFIHSPVNPLLVDIASYSQSLSCRLCLVVFDLPLLTFSILILLFTLINHIKHLSHINYFNQVNHVTNFIPRSLNSNQIKEKEGGRTVHPPLTHHPPQGRILTTFRLFFVARCRQRGRILTNFRLFFVAGGGGLKSALFT